MRTKILALLCLLLSIKSWTCQAQELRATYPIQVTAFINPPYSLKLEDYCNASTPKLNVTLLNRDLMESGLDVKLHLSIKAGNGVRLETNDLNVLPAIRLEPGTPYLLSQDELCPYFQAKNLISQGNLINGQLPEGMIEICITVLDIYTGRIISQTGCARAWITLNRPPILNLPANKNEFPFRDPVNMLFQWTPRHQALSNVEYEFVLKEIWENDTPTEVAFPYSREIYSTTVRTTSLAYTAIEPPLLENKRYAWQVRAVVRSGIEELNLFENNGFTEIHSFFINQSCHEPTNVKHHQDRDHLVIQWQPELNAQATVVAYRTKTTADEWTVIRGNNNYANIFDLAFGLEYEYKVGTVCIDGSIVYSPIYTAILEDWRKAIKLSCGKIPAFDKSNFDPLPELKIGDVFTAGDFPVAVTKTEGSKGTFSGLGWTRLPLFGFVRIAVQFKNVKINTELQLVDGYIETSYDKNETLIADGDRLWNGGNNNGQTKTGAVENKVKVNFSIPENSTIDYDEKSGNLEIKDKDGKTVGSVPIPEKDREIFTSGKPFTYAIQDKDGNIHTITKDKDGNLGIENTGMQDKALPEGSINETAIASKKAIVEFSQGKDAVYAFDKWQDYYKTVSLIANKNTYEFIGDYVVPCKLIPPGKTDNVGFVIKKIDKSLIEDSIIFKTKAGYTVKPKDGQLYLTGGKENDAQDLFALYPDGKGGYLTLGKLKILSYKETTHNVVLIPVNGNIISASSVNDYLNEVYGKVGIQWNVKMDSTFTYTDTSLHSEGSDFFSRYTDEMKEMNNEYMDSRGVLDNKTAYLFLLKEGSIKGQYAAGDMPRGKQFGYIFTESGEDINRTIAHELGHGKFKLRHIFDGEYGDVAKSMEGKTKNLMDYDEGTDLAKWQWDEIHDPALLVNPFESDEDGMATISNDKLFALLEQIRQSIYSGKPIDLEKNTFKTKKGITIGGHKYDFITITTQAKTGTVLKNMKYELFYEQKYFNTEEFSIQYGKEILTIIVGSKEDRDHLLSYLYEKRNNCFLLFVSGYDPTDEVTDYLNHNDNKTEKETLKDYIFGFVKKTPVNYDSKEYWGTELVDFFTLRLKPKNITYMAGYENVGTSNHITMSNFVASMVSSKNAKLPILPTIPPLPNLLFHKESSVILNTTPNEKGFNQRRTNGQSQGKNYIEMLKLNCTKDQKGMIIDTIDVVCHSMGFAHALGVIDEIKRAMSSELKGVKLGRFYIIAPENPGCGEVNLNEWEDVWQYGSNEKEDKRWEQDGVAPQTSVKNLPETKRSFIPEKSPKGFLESHSIENYVWIINLDKNGYVKPRK